MGLSASSVKWNDIYSRCRISDRTAMIWYHALHIWRQHLYTLFNGISQAYLVKILSISTVSPTISFVRMLSSKRMILVEKLSTVVPPVYGPMLELGYMYLTPPSPLAHRDTISMSVPLAHWDVPSMAQLMGPSRTAWPAIRKAIPHDWSSGGSRIGARRGSGSAARHPDGGKPLFCFGIPILVRLGQIWLRQNLNADSYCSSNKYDFLPLLVRISTN
jgi:hypothetical protein